MSEETPPEGYRWATPTEWAEHHEDRQKLKLQFPGHDFSGQRIVSAEEWAQRRAALIARGIDPESPPQRPRLLSTRPEKQLERDKCLIALSEEAAERHGYGNARREALAAMGLTERPGPTLPSWEPA